MTDRRSSPSCRCFRAVLLLAAALASGAALAQVDPGPRGGAAGAGGPFANLSSGQQTNFAEALDVFQEIDSVSGGVAGEEGAGLGPTFNGNSCAMCHAQPAVGGSSPGLASPQLSVPNPQVALATLDGAGNTVPSFITRAGPVREARFVSDGGVHDLYTITGRIDAPGCTLAQPDFVTQLRRGNVIFRIPTPLFGLGLVENTSDEALRANLAATARQRAALGIQGTFNLSGNDGTITRFGWKAQNKSLEIFAGEAYNVEQGVTNELFGNERSSPPASCIFNPTPEDASDTTVTPPTPADVPIFALFMRFAAPPAPAPLTAAGLNGQAVFQTVGCALCHSPSLTTAASPFTVDLSNVTYHPYSDFALHHMGSGLADGISQGAAGSDEFRTAPLWGVGQRLFFLHDGRTSDLLQAIRAHASSSYSCAHSVRVSSSEVDAGASTSASASAVVASSASTSSSGSGAGASGFGTYRCSSEANAVISRFQALKTQDKQDLLTFLRSL